MTKQHIAASWIAGLSAAALIAAACSSSSKGASTTAAPTTTAAPATSTAPSDAPTTALQTTVPETTVPDTSPVPPDAATADALAQALKDNPPGCDPLDPKACLLPFPSDAYTKVDMASDTGQRVDMAAGSAGTNASGVAVDLTEWNRNDGFSPDSSLLTFVPGIDPGESKLPSWTDIGSSLNDDASVVIVDTTTGDRVPLWAEMDAKAASDDERLLVIHPAISLPEGHHFAVGLRGMKDADGKDIDPSVVFRVFRDRIASADLDARRPRMEATFSSLSAAGVERSDLFLAWDFTVASERNLSERLLSIRDQALQTLGDTAPPAFTVTAVEEATDDNIAFQITGTYTVPNFLTGDGGPGQRFNYTAGDTDPDRLPVANGTVQAPFVCNVSNATVAATTPAHLVEYGHGLLGDEGEINAGNVRAFANEWNVVICATKWAGFSADDVGNAAATLNEISNMPTMVDRMQQGVLNQIYLGRLMTRHGGLDSVAQLSRPDGSLMIDTAHLDYDGNSQGGIMGIMLAAVSPDIERAVVGVPGINYSLLLPRSVDFTDYEKVFQPAYPNDLDRKIDIGLLQMLWDRGEGGGYVQHVTADPYEGTKAKPVLLDVAFGDWQVSELAAMIAARTMGATIHRPVAADGRSEEVEPGWGLETTPYPSTGSAIIVWDSGSDPIPLEPHPPTTGRDPHEDPRADPDVRKQKASFLFDDTLIDVCNAAPCTADSTG